MMLVRVKNKNPMLKTYSRKVYDSVIGVSKPGFFDPKPPFLS